MIVVVLLWIAALQAQPAPAVAVDDPALTAAVKRFFETQEQEDIAGYLALWSAQAEVPRLAQLKYVFDSGDDVYSDIVITRAAPAGNGMRVRVKARRQRTAPPRVPGDAPFVSTYAMTVALTFAREGGEWKLLREGSIADDLAADLLEATTDAAREAVLEIEPEAAGQQLQSALARLAGAAAAKGDYRRAQSIYEQQVFAARRGGFGKEHGEALQNVANALYFQRRFPEALAAYEERLALERERKDDAGIAAAQAGIATIRYSFAQYTEALSRYQEALALHEKLDDVAGIAFTSLSIGNIAYLQGDFPAAIAAYRRSLDINRSMQHADGESRSLEGLGRVFTAQGDYAGALDAFDTVRRDKRLASSPGRLGAVAQNVGDVHFRLGNLDAARASFDESRGHFESLRDMPNVGRVLQASGITELVAGRFGMAEDLYKRSGSTCDGAGDRDCSARAVAGLAFAQAAQDKFWDAAASYRKAIELFAALSLREEAARSEIGLSQALAGAGDYAGGIDAAVRARREAVALDSDDVLWRALTAEARAVRKNGDRDRALGVARAAVVTLDRVQQAMLDRPGVSLSADAAGAVATFAILQAESGDPGGAFASSERLRAIDVRARLATNEREIARGMTPEEREEERRLAGLVTTSLAMITREKGLPKPDPARIAAVQTSLDEAVAARRVWMQRLFERVPELAVWRGLGPPRQFEAAKPLFEDSGAILLSLVLDEEDLLVLVGGRKSGGVDPASAGGEVTLDAYVGPVKRRQVAELAGALQQPRLLADPAAWRKTALGLMALLPQAVVTRLASASAVMILPHDVIWRVPFDALPSGDGYLGDHAHVAVAGSLDLLLRAQPPPPAGVASMVGIGAPELTAARLERLKQMAPAWSLRAADEAMTELQSASGTYPAGGRTLLSGGQATEQAARAAVAAAGALHIAAPFRINAASPLFSPILLSTPEPPAVSGQQTAEPQLPAGSPSASPRRADATDDGTLELREIMNLTAGAPVVVLSDSAATSMRDGAESADILEWGWLAAGVRSLLVSRWSAPPTVRVRLLTEFHRQLAAGAAPAAALSSARRTIRSMPETAAPINWAGWMLLGAVR